MKKSYIFKIVLIILVIASDLITKLVLFGVDSPLIPDLIGSRAVTSLNTGGAFGILSNNIWFLIAITVVFLAIIILIEIKWKNSSNLYSFALAFIVGGAIGNLIDRIFLGGVRDFLYFVFYPSFPTFNVADSFLCIGVALMVIYLLFVYKEPKKNNKVKE